MRASEGLMGGDAEVGMALERFEPHDLGDDPGVRGEDFERGDLDDDSRSQSWGMLPIIGMQAMSTSWNTAFTSLNVSNRI